jgi:hypothetical protein
MPTFGWPSCANSAIVQARPSVREPTRCLCSRSASTKAVCALSRGAPPLRRSGRRRFSILYGASGVLTRERAPLSVEDIASLNQPSHEWFAAGDCDRCTGGIARQRIREHDIGCRQFSRLSRALQRDLLSEVLDGFLRHGGRDKWCPNRSRSYRIHPDAFFRQHDTISEWANICLSPPKQSVC